MPAYKLIYTIYEAHDRIKELESSTSQACMVQGLLGFNASTMPEQVIARVNALTKAEARIKELEGLLARWHEQDTSLVDWTAKGADYDLPVDTQQALGEQPTGMVTTTGEEE